MDNRVIHRQIDPEEAKDVEVPRSRLVQRAGTRDAGLFPGWGPKI